MMTARLTYPRSFPRSLVLVALLALAAGLALPAATSAQPPDGTPGDSASALARAAAADYRAAARYPAWSRPVPAGLPDPVRAERTPAPHSLAGPDGELPRLTVWAAEVSFVVPETVVLHARLDGAAQGAETVVTGEVRSASGAVLGTVIYADDGVAPDARRGDGVHTAAFKLDQDAVPELAETFQVDVLATLADGDFRQASSGFLYSNPWARLTGRFRDEVRDGNLVIRAQVDVGRQGRFHLQGTVETPKGEAVGWAQASVELPAGRHWIDLAFYGLIFPERGAAGPFRLGSVTLATTGSMPNALGPVWVNAHTTRAYPASRFTAAPFGRPDLLEAAERLEGRGPAGD